MSYTKVHLVCAWLKLKLGTLIGNIYENGCIRIHETWSQSVPLLLTINFPFLKENSQSHFQYKIRTDESVFLEDLYQAYWKHDCFKKVGG